MPEDSESEECAIEVKDGILELLECAKSSNVDNTAAFVARRQENICLSLIQALERQQRNSTTDASESPLARTYGNDEGNQFIRTSIADYNHKSKEEDAPNSTSATLNIRQALGNMSLETMSKLVSLLTDLFSDRVDIAELLPATQDELANEEAMGKAAITITKLSLVAAQLYAILVGIPGAWGAGLIDVGALSSLSAMLRRWCLECRGRESKDNTREEGSKRKSSVSKRAPRIKCPRKKKQHQNEEDGSDSDWEGNDHHDLGDAFEDKNDNVVEDLDIEGGLLLSAEDLIAGGLGIATALGNVPCSREFMDWPDEAREAVMDAVTTSLATSAALKSYCFNSKLASCAVNSLSTSVQKCLLVARKDAGGNNQADREEYMTKQHETSVFILRGLLPIITMKAEVPFGQSGKESASNSAISTLEGFVRSVASEYRSSPPISLMNQSTLPAATPMATRGRNDKPQPSNSMLTSPFGSSPATGRKGRKKRVSFGGVGGDDDTVVPPTLKKSVTPFRSRSRLSIENTTPSESLESPRPILSAIVGLMQKLATTEGLGRADNRNRMVDTLLTCLEHLSLAERAHFLKSEIRCCRSLLSSHRILAVELIGAVLSEEWLWRERFCGIKAASTKELWSPSKTPSSRRGSLSPMNTNSPDSMHIALLCALHGRIADKNTQVRARAAFSLGDLFRKISEGEVLNTGGDAWITFEESITEVADDLLVGLRKRAAQDEKANPKKAAIIALVEILVLGETLVFRSNKRLCIAEKDVDILARLCMDNCVSIRKTAAEGITKLLEKCFFPGHCSVETAFLLQRDWSGVVLPLVLDAELSCSGRAVELFTYMVIDPLVEIGGRKVEWENEAQKRRYGNAWTLLAYASENTRQQGASCGEASSLRAALKKIFEASGSTERGIARSLLKEIRKVAISTLEEDQFRDDIVDARIGAWFLLDAFVDVQSSERSGLSQVIKKSSIDVSFLLSSWESLVKLTTSPSTPDHYMASLRESMRSCLKLLSHLALLLSTEDAICGGERLKDMLGTFALGPDLVGTALSALVALTSKTCEGSTPPRTKEECSTWIIELYDKCQNEISSYISNSQSSYQEPTKEEETSLACALFMVGELSLIGFRADEDSSSRKAAAKKDYSNADVDSILGLHKPPSKYLLGLVQTLLPKHLPSAGAALAEPKPTPDAARAHAFLTLGKLCLRDETLAKESLLLLARELHPDITHSSTAVQCNALLVIGDLCVKYTNMVDKYLPVMAACLQSFQTSLSDSNSDGTAIVRRNAVLMLSSLLLQDYVKWRGLLFHRFLAASVDSDEGVAKLAEMALSGPLLMKYPKLFVNNFVEAIFVLNKCTAHPIHAAAATAGDNGAGIAVGFEGIDFSGSAGKSRRLRAYKMMLLHVSDEEKIEITARLTKVVLGEAVKSEGDLGSVCRSHSAILTQNKGEASTLQTRLESAFRVLSDTFALLTSPELKVGRRGANDADDIEDGGPPREAQLAIAAKGRLLSKMSRKHLIEIILPILCDLKTILQASCSPLLKDLMRYIVEIFRAYKSEVKEFLANDPTLLQEVEYDARQFKKTQNMERSQSQSPSS